MVVCKFWKQGNCRKGNNCTFEHPGDNRSFGGNSNAQRGPFGAQNQNSSKWNIDEDEIRNDLDQRKTRPKWILSAYGPVKNGPASLFTDIEFSPEEVRHRFYEQQSNGRGTDADNEAIALWSKASNDMQNVANNARDVVRYFENAEKDHPNRLDWCNFDGTMPPEKYAATMKSNNQPSTSNNPFSSGSDSASSNPFSKPPAFGQSPFGQQSSAPKAPFGQSPFNQQSSAPKSPFGAGAGFGSGASAFKPATQGAFGKPAFGSSGFGQSGFGQAAQPANSGFGQPAQSGSGFGQASQPGSGVGQPSQPVPAGFGQPSAFGQPSKLASGFGQPSQPGSGFGQTSNLGQSASNNPFAKPSGFGQLQGGAVFGSNKQQGSTSGFGQAGAQPAFGQSGFGQVAKPSGFVQQNNSQPAFGANPFSQKPAGAQPVHDADQAQTPNAGSSGFGPNPFGKQAATQPAFGASGFGGAQPSPGFGQTASVQPAASNNPFGGAPANAARQSGAGTFGGLSPFGQAQSTAAPPVPSNEIAMEAQAVPAAAQPASFVALPAHTATGALSAMTGRPARPLHYNQTVPSRGETRYRPDKNPSTWRGFQVEVIVKMRPDTQGNEVLDHTIPVYQRPDGRGKERIWFPADNQDTKVVALQRKIEDYQAEDSCYTDEVKEQYRYLFDEGRWKEGQLPLVPPMREWIAYDF